MEEWTLQNYQLISQGKCPYGGYCADPDYPSDCQINGFCFGGFTSIEEKQVYDALPDKFFFYSNRQKLRLFKFAWHLENFMNDLDPSDKDEGSWGCISSREALQALLDKFG